MLTKRVIPCLDVKNGRVVKGVNFEGLRDAGDPVEIAKRYDAEGADELTFLDITASHEERRIILDVVAQTASCVFMPVTVGGGVRTLQDIRDLLNAGADKVSINTAAVTNPDFVGEAAAKFGSQCIVVAIDARRVSNQPHSGDEGEAPSGFASGGGFASSCLAGGFEIFTHGGRKPTGLKAVEWALKMQSLGAGEILLTSMDRDGTKIGYDLELTKAITSVLDIPLIASGGVGNLEHLYEGIALGGADAVLAASIFHYREYTIKEAKDYLKSRGLPVRLNY